jgi:plasmid stabilization system protein ParE
MKVRYTDPAIEDFQQATAYFLEHAPFVAADFADSVDRAIAQLRENPYLVQETERAGIRRWYINRFRYSIYYTIAGDELVFLHIRHAARLRPWEHDRNDE